MSWVEGGGWVVNQISTAGGVIIWEYSTFTVSILLNLKLYTLTSHLTHKSSPKHPLSTLKGRHTVCSVFLESKTLFFFVYVPEEGHRYHASLPLTWIEGILAPNSVETLTDPRPPPETPVQVCVL